MEAESNHSCTLAGDNGTPLVCLDSRTIPSGLITPLIPTPSHFSARIKMWQMEDALKEWHQVVTGQTYAGLLSKPLDSVIRVLGNTESSPQDLAQWRTSQLHCDPSCTAQQKTLTPADSTPFNNHVVTTSEVADIVVGAVRSAAMGLPQHGAGNTPLQVAKKLLKRTLDEVCERFGHNTGSNTGPNTRRKMKTFHDANTLLEQGRLLLNDTQAIIDDLTATMSRNELLI